MSKLTVEVRDDRGEPSISLSGELIGPELGHMQHVCLTALRKLNGSELALDMAGVHYIDSLSIGRLIALNSTAEKNGKLLVLKNCQSRVRDTLRMLKIDTLIRVS
jgi:anti-anti-sigma factor